MIPEPNMIFLESFPKWMEILPNRNSIFCWRNLGISIKTPPRFGEFHVFFLFFSVEYNLSGRVQVIWDVYQGRLGAFIS